MARRHQLRIAGAALGLCLALPSLALAQTAANRLPGVIDRPVPQVPLPPPAAPLGPLGGTPTPETVPDANAPVPTIKQVVFSGLGVLSDGDLQPVVAPYLNRPLTRGDLAKMKYDIAKRYYEDGYILVRVVTPPNQDLTRGVLNVTVYEAKIDKVTVGKDAAVRPFITGAITSEVQPGEVFNESDVESMVRDLDDLHGAKASVNLVPGSQVGTTALDVHVDKTNDFNQFVSVNNYGSKLTGEWLFNAGLQWGNLLGLGELYNFNFTHSNSDLLTVSGGIQTPIGIKNIILDTSYLYSNSTVSRGSGAPGHGRHDGPVPHRAVERAAEHGQAEDHGSVRVRCGPLPVEHPGREPELGRQDAALHRWTATMCCACPTRRCMRLSSSPRGWMCFDGSSEGDDMLSRAGNPDAFILRPTLLARQNLWTFAGLGTASIKGLVTGQWASDALLASDLFAIGGYGSVRGFQPAQDTGESGMQVSVELDQEVFQRQGWGVSIGPWFDGGWVWNKLDRCHRWTTRSIRWVRVPSCIPTSPPWGIRRCASTGPIRWAITTPPTSPPIPSTSSCCRISSNSVRT